jgi:hypothetical protein
MLGFRWRSSHTLAACIVTVGVLLSGSWHPRSWLQVERLCTMAPLHIEHHCVLTYVGGLDITLGVLLYDPRWSVGGIQ